MAATVLEALDRFHSEKYRSPNQSREQHTARLARSLASNPRHEDRLIDIFSNDRFLPAGRVQRAGGSDATASFFNCIVSGTIDDSMEGIGQALKEALLTLRLGSGIGYDFSTLRPRGATISTLQSASSGPISFMEVFDAACGTIHLAHRRGAQMGVMRVDHPDIEEFIDAKLSNRLSRFNLSVAITDAFMDALARDSDFSLHHNGNYYKSISARKLWDKITKNAYHSAEPGLLFIDTINKQNNLYYCEYISATNPCAEQPLPPYGACLLGSFNLNAYIFEGNAAALFTKGIKWEQWQQDINDIVEAYDNIFERSIYALPQHKVEAINKRRIGLGITGIANAIELLQGKPCYGDSSFNRTWSNCASFLRNAVYGASIKLAAERGSFALYDSKRYGSAKFIQTLDDYTRRELSRYGIRNSHLISYAPTGTISLAHGNISSGIEPVFYANTKRKILMSTGLEVHTIPDYNVRVHGFLGRTLEHCYTEDHLGVHEIAQQFCDSAVSKTINMPAETTLEEYQHVWEDAYKRGAKGLSVYRPNEIRAPIISSGDCEGGSCTIPAVDVPIAIAA